MDVIERLERTGMNAMAYRRGPLGKDIFTAAVSPRPATGAIRIWPGNAEIDVRTSKRHRQAVLNVQESSRELVRRVRFWADADDDQEELLECARNSFPVFMGDDVTYQADAKSLRKDHASLSGEEDHWTCRVTAVVPQPSAQHLLVGVDETHHFISALPQKVNSVDEAHEILRPGDVPKGSLRQGEWFFVPVKDPKRIQQLEQMAIRPYRRGGNRYHHYDLMQELEEDSSHLLQGVLVETEHISPRKYGIGVVFDDRGGRHEPLTLNGWHRIIRNKEQVLENSRTQRYWD